MHSGAGAPLANEIMHRTLVITMDAPGGSWRVARGA